MLDNDDDADDDALMKQCVVSWNADSLQLGRQY